MYYIKWLRNFYYVIFYGRFVIVKVKLIWSHDFRGHKLCFISFICAYNESSVRDQPFSPNNLQTYLQSQDHNHKLEPWIKLLFTKSCYTKCYQLISNISICQISFMIRVTQFEGAIILRQLGFIIYIVPGHHKYQSISSFSIIES